jgi:hypothetical protein
MDILYTFINNNNNISSSSSSSSSSSESGSGSDSSGENLSRQSNLLFLTLYCGAVCLLYCIVLGSETFYIISKQSSTPGGYLLYTFVAQRILRITLLLLSSAASVLAAASSNDSFIITLELFFIILIVYWIITTGAVAIETAITEIYTYNIKNGNSVDGDGDDDDNSNDGSNDDNDDDDGVGTVDENLYNYNRDNYKEAKAHRSINAYIHQVDVE